MSEIAMFLQVPQNQDSRFGDVIVLSALEPSQQSRSKISSIQRVRRANNIRQVIGANECEIFAKGLHLRLEFRLIDFPVCKKVITKLAFWARGVLDSHVSRD
jgi:hypothetical protein